MSEAKKRWEFSRRDFNRGLASFLAGPKDLFFKLINKKSPLTENEAEKLIWEFEMDLRHFENCVIGNVVNSSVRDKTEEIETHYIEMLKKFSQLAKRKDLRKFAQQGPIRKILDDSVANTIDYRQTWIKEPNKNKVQISLANIQLRLATQLRSSILTGRFNLPSVADFMKQHLKLRSFHKPFDQKLKAKHQVKTEAESSLESNPVKKNPLEKSIMELNHPDMIHSWTHNDPPVLSWIERKIRNEYS